MATHSFLSLVPLGQRCELALLCSMAFHPIFAVWRRRLQPVPLPKLQSSQTKTSLFFASIVRMHGCAEVNILRWPMDAGVKQCLIVLQ